MPRNATATRSPLTSKSTGAAANDLITACSVRMPRQPPPPDPPRAPALSLAFSGGGFRATLTALGILRFLAQAGLLPQVRYVSSVSGGSVANSLFACHYEELEKREFAPEALDELVVRPFVERISTKSLTWTLARNLWRTASPHISRTDLLADQFDHWFLGRRELESLSPSCRFVFNAASFTSGVRFGFERDRVGDWVVGQVSTAGTGIRVAQAAAASAAVPGFFAPFTLRGVDFPCANGQVIKLLDGGAYDNSGLEAVDDLPQTLLIGVNAGGLFHTGSAYGRIPVIRDLSRANSLLYRQSTALRARDMVDRFQAWEQAVRAGQEPPSWGRQGVLFGLATTFGPDHIAPEWADRDEHPEWRIELAEYKTSFDRFPLEICHRLIQRGWWLTGAALTRFHPEVLTGASLPVWVDL